MCAVVKAESMCAVGGGDHRERLSARQIFCFA
jgi:hypothetical protein